MSYGIAIHIKRSISEEIYLLSLSPKDYNFN